MTKIAFLYDDLNPSVRLCGYEQLKFLQEKNKLCVSFIKMKEITKVQCKEHDIFFFIRSSSALSFWLAQYLHYYKKFIIYVLDDDLLDIPDDLVSSKYYRQKHIKKRIFCMLKICNVFLSPSIELLEKYSSIVNRTTRIEEPALNYVIKKYEQQPKTIRIGFAGSVDRTSDVDVILMDVIIALKKKYQENITFEIMGIKPNSKLTPYCNYHEYQEDYIEYQNYIRNLNLTLGLAPIPDTSFHSYKHYNKYIEYGASGIIGIYSNQAPYRKIIYNYQNGILCENTFDSWFSSISYLIEHPELYQTLQKNISMDISKKYELSVVAYQLLGSIPELTNYNAPKHALGGFRMVKYISFLGRIKDNIIFYKWGIFYKIYQKFILNKI